MGAAMSVAEIERLITQKVADAISTHEASQSKGKRKREEIPNVNSSQQWNKRLKAVGASTAGSVVKKGYLDTKPYCNKCKRHHKGHCDAPCMKCKKFGHQTRDCRKPTANPRAPLACFECGSTKHLRKNCSRLRSNDNNNNARGSDE